MEEKPEVRELVVGFSDGMGDLDGERISFSLQTESQSHRYWMKQNSLPYFVCYLLAVSEDVASKAGKLKPYGSRAERVGSPLAAMLRDQINNVLVETESAEISG